MSSRVASAPGKLILIGEFAVLQGAPAIVMAIDRRAQVRVSSASENRVTAAEICEREISFTIDEQRHVSWIGADPGQSVRLELLAQIIARFWPGTPVHIETDTSAFYEDGIKMGFGSSAALTVAASAALCGHQSALDELVETHRAAQDGRGSGFDVAASLHGGVIRFKNAPLETASIAVPAGLHMCCIWTGQAASTSAFLRGLDALGQRKKAIEPLIDSARTVVADLDDSAASWVLAVRNYSQALRRFADATALPIFGGGHAEIASIADINHVAYKPSGAGGGDLGVVVSEDAAAIEAFVADLRAIRVRVLRLAVDQQGLVMN